MMTTLTLPPHIETYFEVHQEERESFYKSFQTLVSTFENKIDNIDIVHIKPKNRWVKSVEEYSEIGKDSDIDFSKIINNNRTEFRENFNL